MKTLATFFVCCLLAGSLGAQWVQTSGPEGIAISSAVYGKDISIFISQRGDLYEIKSGGWQKFASFPGASKLRVIGDAIYAMKNQMLWRSGDHGVTWSELPITGEIEVGDDGFYNVTNDSLFKSSDNGITWRLVDTVGIMTGIVHPHKNYLFSYANPFMPKLLRSSDGGIEWTMIASPPPFALNVGVADITSDKDDLYLLLGNGEIYTSSDNGDSWTKSIDAPTTDQIQYGKLIKAGMYFWVESSNGIYVFVRGLDKWMDSRINGTLLSAGENAIVSNYSGIYEITYFRFHTQLITGLRKSSISALEVRGSTILASAHNGIHRTTDYGNSWKEVSPVTPYYFAHDETTIYASTNTGLYASTDDGLTWKPFATPRDDEWQDVTSIASDGQSIYLSYGKTFGEHSQTNWVSGGMLRSTDHGATWSNINNGLPSNIETYVPVNQVVFHNNALYITTLEGIFRSETGGFWTRADAGIPFGQFKSGTFVSGGNYLYFSYANDLYRLEAGGEEWIKLPSITEEYMLMSSFGGYTSAVGDSLFAIGYKYDPSTTTYEYRNFLYDGNAWTDISSSFPPGVTLNAFTRVGSGWMAGSLHDAVWRSGIVASVEEPAALAVYLYPNPVENKLFIKADGDAMITIFDMLGRAIIYTKAEEYIDVKGLLPGSYILELSQPKSNSLRRSFIKH